MNKKNNANNASTNLGNEIKFTRRSSNLENENL